MIGTTNYLLGSVSRDRLAEAFIRGIQVGAEDPELAGDGDAMYAAFRRWFDSGQDAHIDGRIDGD